MEAKEFYLDEDRYLRQVRGGILGPPKYIKASPGAAVVVSLPAKIMRNGELVDHPEDKHLKLKPPTPPINPLPNREQQGPPLNLAAEVDGDGRRKKQQR